MNKPQKEVLIILILLSVIFVSINVKAELGTWKQNDCVNIRVLSNCSSVNISEVTVGQNVFIVNKNMQKLAGQTYNYSFCNTSTIGTYTYSWNPSCTDCSTGNCGNTFTVSESGTKLGLPHAIIVIVFIFLGGLCFFIGNQYKEDKYILKSFFYLCALLFGVLSVNSARIIASESSDLFRMSFVGLAFIISIVSVMFLYTFIYWTIQTFKQVKNKKEIRWQY